MLNGKVIKKREIKKEIKHKKKLMNKRKITSNINLQERKKERKK